MDMEGYDFEELELLNLHLAMDHLNMASIHGAEGRLDMAIREYSMALELDPNLYSGYVNRGKLFWRKGDIRRALEDLTDAIRLEPMVPSTYVYRGDVHLGAGNREAARRDYLRALELDPASPQVMQRLRWTAEKRGRGRSPGGDGAGA